MKGKQYFRAKSKVQNYKWKDERLKNVVTWNYMKTSFIKWNINLWRKDKNLPIERNFSRGKTSQRKSSLNSRQQFWEKAHKTSHFLIKPLNSKNQEEKCKIKVKKAKVHRKKKNYVTFRFICNSELSRKQKKIYTILRWKDSDKKVLYSVSYHLANLFNNNQKFKEFIIQGYLLRKRVKKCICHSGFLLPATEYILNV